MCDHHNGYIRYKIVRSKSKSLEIAFQIDLYNQIASMAFMPLQNSKFFDCVGQYALALLVNWSSVKNLRAATEKRQTCERSERATEFRKKRIWEEI